MFTLSWNFLSHKKVTSILGSPVRTEFQEGSYFGFSSWILPIISIHIGFGWGPD